MNAVIYSHYRYSVITYIITINAITYSHYHYKLHYILVLHYYLKHFRASSHPWRNDPSVAGCPCARIHGCGQSPRSAQGSALLHSVWPSMHLICNNSKMIRDKMAGIFVKCPWHSTFKIAKYEYSTQNSFLENQSSQESANSHSGRRYIFFTAKSNSMVLGSSYSSQCL